MSLSVDVPQDLRQYETKIMFGMTGRQLIFGALGLGFAGATYLIGKVIHIPMSLLMNIVMFATMPVFGIGFIKIKGQPFEKFIKQKFAYVFQKQIVLFETRAGNPKILGGVELNETVESGKTTTEA